MIAFIAGKIVQIFDQKLVIVQSGIGFEISTPSALNYVQNQEISLFIHLHWSAENGPSLYGFSDLVQKDLFLQLIDCPGVGPKLALSLLQQSTVSGILQAITAQDVAFFSKLKGVGTKKAETLCMHLKDKINKLIILNPQLNNVETLGVWHDVHQTLQSLNYSTFEIRQATEMVKESALGQNLPFDLLLRKTLIVLAKK